MDTGSGMAGRREVQVERTQLCGAWVNPRQCHTVDEGRGLSGWKA